MFCGEGGGQRLEAALRVVEAESTVGSKATTCRILPLASVGKRLPLEKGTFTAFEAARKAIVGHVKRGGQLWIRVFPDKPVSARPAETRMGKGKGAVEYWVAPVNSGKILFELGDLPDDLSREALRLASHKLALKTEIVSRSEQF